MQQPKKLSPAIAAIIVIVLVGIAATAVIVINNNAQTKTNESIDSSTTDATPTNSDQVADAPYEDGTYSATGSYQTPNGEESIELTVTLTNGIITSTSLVTNARSGEAKQYQGEFASGYKELVVGKDVDEVSLSRVAGSSLTSNGFNEALDQIKSDAAA